MKKFLIIAGAIALAITITSDALAKKKPHVVIHKRPACTTPGCDGSGTQVTRPQAIAFLAFVAPPLLVAYDLQRRTNCEGDTLGLGGPGFTTPITPATGNVMTTAYMRGQCPNVAAPKRY